MATTLNTQISALATQVGTDVKDLLAKVATIGDVRTLTTSQKATVVVAVNELKAAIDAVQTNIGAQINDESNDTSHTWSGSKISTEISTKCQEVKDALLGGAGDAYDTLKELADLIETNEDAITALQELAGAHVRYDQAQELEPSQQTQARSNIGAAAAADVGTVSSLTTTEKTNLVGAVNEVKTQADKGVSDAAAAASAATAQSAAEAAQSVASTAKTTAESAQSSASAAQTAVNTLTTNVGATDTDFVGIYNTAKGVSA